MKQYNFFSFFFSLLLLIFSQNWIYSTPGQLDTTFNSNGVQPGTVITNITSPAGTSDTARAIAIDSNSKFIVAGSNGIDFTVGRYSTAGVLDVTFGGSNNGYVTTDMGGVADIAYGVAIDSNQNIIAVGTNGTDFSIARYTSDGILDTTFGIDGDGRAITQIGASTTNTIYGVAIDTSDNIVVVGTDETNLVVARYLGTGVNAGTLDTSFNSGGSQPGVVTTTIGTTAVGYSVVIQTDGKIVVCGSTTTGTTTSFVLARYLSTGLIDSFANDAISPFGNVVPASAIGYVTTQIAGTATSIAYGVAINGSGQIFACGRSGTSAAPFFTIARYTTAGVLDTGFNTTGYNRSAISSSTNIAWGVTIDASSKIVVCGQSGTAAAAHFTIARYTTAGAFDTTFNSVGYNRLTVGTAPNIGYDVAINGSGNITIAGSSTSGAATDFALAQYLGTNGSLNTAGFGSPNGYILTNIGTGSVDSANATAIQPDGKIVVVGASAGAIALARYTELGVLDTTFGTAGIVSGALGTTTASVAFGVAIQSNSYIVVAGAAATAGTTPNRFMLARYTPTGALDTTFGGSSTGYVTTAINGATSIAYGLVIDSSGKFVVCGKSGATNTPIFTVARYTSAGVLDTGTFGSGTGFVRTTISTISIAYSVALTSSGNIVACGQSGTTLALPAFTVAEYTSAGVLNSGSFGTAGSPAGTVRTSIGTTSIAQSVAINSSGNIVVAGQTTTAANTNFAVAEYTSAGVLNSGSFGTGGSPAGTVITEFGDTDIGYAVAIQSNGYIVVSGISFSNVAMARYDTTGVLDATFGTGGTVTTTLINGTEVGPMGLFLQPNNRIVICCTTSSTNGDFDTLRYLGDPAPQGCIDVTYPTTLTGSDIPGYVTYPAGSSAAYNPQVTGLQVQMDNSAYVISKDLLTTAESRLVKLNANGSVALPAIIISQGVGSTTGASDVIEDSQKNAIVIGTNITPHGWMARYTTYTGALVADSTFGTSGFIIESTNSTSFKRVCQQTNGRYVVMGQGATSTSGLLIGYTLAGVLDTSFGTSSSGFITLASSTFSDMLIDSNNGIYVDYAVTSGNIKIAKYLANGSGLDTSNFGASGIVDTGLAVASYGAPVLTFDNSGNIIIAAVATSSGNMQFQR